MKSWPGVTTHTSAVEPSSMLLRRSRSVRRPKVVCRMAQTGCKPGGGSGRAGGPGSFRADELLAGRDGGCWDEVPLLESCELVVTPAVASVRTAAEEPVVVNALPLLPADTVALAPCRGAANEADGRWTRPHPVPAVGASARDGVDEPTGFVVMSMRTMKGDCVLVRVISCTMALTYAK